MAADGFLISSAFYAEGPVRNDLHYHNAYELIFVTEGEVELTAGSSHDTARANHLIRLANLERHALAERGGKYHRYCVTLNVPEADGSFRSPELLNVLRNHPANFPHCLDLTEDRAEVIGLFQRILACRAEEPFAGEMAACLISELLILALRRYPELLRQELTEGCKDRILAVQTYLAQHYAEPLRISSVCKQFFLSDSYLSHQFKALTGFSPRQYLTLLRLKQAVIRLHDSNLPVGEIAAACGFSDLNNFSKLFRREYGCSPTEFRLRG